MPKLESEASFWDGRDERQKENAEYDPIIIHLVTFLRKEQESLLPEDMFQYWPKSGVKENVALLRKGVVNYFCVLSTLKTLEKVAISQNRLDGTQYVHTRCWTAIPESTRIANGGRLEMLPPNKI